MSEEGMKKDFVGFEYREVKVKKKMMNLYEDHYTCFGWIEEGISEPIDKVDYIILKFKRDRKIRNKAELTRLQRQFEACANDIAALEQSKGIKASAAAYVIGVIGTAFMAGSVFAVTGGKVPLSILLAVPAFLGWVVSYPVFREIKSKKTEEVTPLIDRKYDELYTVCEKASTLIYQ